MPSKTLKKGTRPTDENMAAAFVFATELVTGDAKNNQHEPVSLNGKARSRRKAI